MESEQTKSQKEIVEKLQKDLQHFEQYKVYLTKYVMEDKNVGTIHYDRASNILMKLKVHIQKLHDELGVEDITWLGFQLDDLEAEICQTNQP